jgi:hypothetical protein
MIINYKSNPKISDTDNIGLVSLADNVFIFTAKITPAENCTNYFKFTVCDESASKEYGFEIDPFLTDTIYEVSDTFISTRPFRYKEGGRIMYFNEVFQIKNDKLYKRISKNDSALDNWVDYYIDNGVTYALKASDDSNAYKLQKKHDNMYVIKKNIINNVKPLNIKTLDGKDGINDIVFTENELFFNEEKWLRIIISENTKLITVWLTDKKENGFKKIKTFSYLGGIEKAGIKLSYDDSLKLSDISVSFFKTDIE